MIRGDAALSTGQASVLFSHGGLRYGVIALDHDHVDQMHRRSAISDESLHPCRVGMAALAGDVAHRAGQRVELRIEADAAATVCGLNRTHGWGAGSTGSTGSTGTTMAPPPAFGPTLAQFAAQRRRAQPHPELP